MSKVYFKNEGEIDILAVTTFGVSVKECSAIGFFGTGLKHSISVILRLGGVVTIYSGTHKHTFSTQKQEVRGKEFEFIYMDEDRLGFTTQNAKTWEPWMAVREILCNCKDEGGLYTTEEQYPEEGYTLIVVEEPNFFASFNSRNEFILEDKAPFLSNDNVDIYKGSTKNLYYKGVKVFEAEHPYMFTYNLNTHVDLTEDRTLKYVTYENNYTLAKHILEQSNIEFIRKVMNCGDCFMEYHLGYEIGAPSDTFSEELFAAKTINLDMPKGLRKFQPEISSNLESIPEATLNKIQQMQLDKALSMLEHFGFTNGYPVRVVDDLGKGLLGFADRDTNTIYISKKVFSMGTKYLAGTIYEEYVHLYHGVNDETRAFQDVVIQDLMSLIELERGECF